MVFEYRRIFLPLHLSMTAFFHQGTQGLMFVVWTVPSSVLDDPIAVSTASFTGLPRNWDFTPFSDTLGFIYYIPIVTLKFSKSAACCQFRH